MKPVLLSAIQPTNFIQLGNYIGAIRNWVSIQKEHDCIFFAVDMHSITSSFTSKEDPQHLRNATYYSIATYIAAGLDPEACTLFVQSHVHEHAELAWALNCFSYMGELSRMTQFKDKSQKQGENIRVGLFTYPVLMAADILLYDTHQVPVGADQKQHIELTRDIAIRMNNQFGDDLFKVPQPLIAKVGSRVMSLQNPEQKMSKSDPDPNASVFLNESDDVIRKKIKRAVTDSGNTITDNPEQKGVRNLLEIQSSLTGNSVAAIAASYAGKMYGHLKADTAEIVVQAISPIRQKTDELLKDRGYLDKILQQGAEKAQARARITLRRVYEKIGFIPLAKPR